jgi:hypothetical protein
MNQAGTGEIHLLWCIEGSEEPAEASLPGTVCVRLLSVSNARLVTADQHGRVAEARDHCLSEVNPAKPSPEQIAEWRMIEEELGYWKGQQWPADANREGQE